MPDRVRLVGDAELTRQSHRATLTIPYQGTSAHLHLYAAEIVNRLRQIVTSGDDPQALRAVLLEFGSTSAVVQLAGPDAAIDHWLAGGRLITTLQATIDRVHDRHLAY